MSKFSKRGKYDANLHDKKGYLYLGANMRGDMNRSKYAVRTIQVLKKCTKDGDYWLTLSQIDEQIRKNYESDTSEISRDTKRRALRDLLELDLVKKESRKYIHKYELEKQKKIAIHYLKKRDRAKIAKEYSDKLFPREVHEIAKKVINKAGYDLTPKPGYKLTSYLDNSETEKIITKIENL